MALAPGMLGSNKLGPAPLVASNDAIRGNPSMGVGVEPPKVIAHPHAWSLVDLVPGAVEASNLHLPWGVQGSVKK